MVTKGCLFDVLVFNQTPNTIVRIEDEDSEIIIILRERYYEIRSRTRTLNLRD
jgi:hypothetical protein